MKRFLKHLFNKRTVYTVKTKFDGLNPILRIIFSDRDISYERLDYDRSCDWYCLEIVSSYRDIKTLIKAIRQTLSWDDLLNTEIYEDKDGIDLLSKSMGAM